MKINMIFPANGWSGGLLTALAYLDYMVKKGDDVICYIPKTRAHHGWRNVFMAKSLVEWYLFGSWRNRLKDYDVTYKYPLHISNSTIRDADVTIATFWMTSFWVKKLDKSKGKKCYFIQDYETWGNDKDNRLCMKSYEIPLDLRITVSTALHDRIKKAHGTESTVICNGIKKAFIADSIPQRDDRYITIGFPFREQRGKNVDLKNCQMGIDILHKLKSKYSNIRLKTFGFNKPDSWYDDIDFLENPTRDQLKSFYDSVDIFYVPSLYEGWGLPAMEAMTRGCAVAAHNSGVITEYGVDEENCKMLSDPSNPDTTFEDLEELVTDSELRKKISKNGLKTVQDKTFENSAEKFYQAVHGLKI